MEYHETAEMRDTKNLRLISDSNLTEIFNHVTFVFCGVKRKVNVISTLDGTEKWLEVNKFP